MSNLVGDSSNPQVAAISGKHASQGIGIQAESAEKWAVRAIAPKDTAIYATSNTGIGVHAESTTNTGVYASSEQAIAVRAAAKKDTAVYATSNTGIGVHAESAEKWAIRANAPRDTAIFATSDTGFGVDARSKTNTGVQAYSEQGIGIYGKGGTYAGYFEGVVKVTDDIQIGNSDCAEEFDVLDLDGVEPGTLMVIDSEGSLRQSTNAYDKRVAGVISGAGDLKPGLVLGAQSEKSGRFPIALMGRVYCKVDADLGSIEVGDLLTSSSTPGHAMKAADPAQAFGAVIGKALRPLVSGRGLIPILVALQ